MKSVLKECRDWLEYLLIPAVSVILPWSLSVKFFWLVARVPFLYRNTTLHCLAGAKHLNVVEPLTEAQWIQHCKVSQMIDLADIFLMLTRGRSYWDKYIDENLSEQLDEQQFIFTPHYGGGMWLYKLLFLQQRNVYALFNLDKMTFKAASLSSHLRMHVLKKHGVKIVSPQSISAVRNILKENGSIVVGPDLPTTYDIKTYQPITPWGKLNLAAQFFDLAARRDITVMHTVFAMDVKTGRRHFTAEVQPKASAEVYASAFAKLTATAIAERPYLWRMLIVAPEVMISNDLTH